MTDKLPRFERACAELLQAMGNFVAALSAEMKQIEACVPPHSHPPEPSAPAVTDRQDSVTREAVVTADASGGDLTDDVSSQTAPAEASPPPAAFSVNAKWTPERMRLLRETYTSGVPLDDILDRLNALPGKTSISKNQIAPFAASKGWKRPPEKAPVKESKIVEVWTQQRLAIAQQAYEGGLPMLEIVRAVNALPGAQVSAARVIIIAAARNWKRGVSVAALPNVDDPVPADATEILHWAGERGIVVQGRALPMDEINARRRHLGMAPFVLTPSMRGARA